MLIKCVKFSGRTVFFVNFYLGKLSPVDIFNEQ
jgi:hypothetical protein